MDNHTYYVYLLASQSGTLYVGVTKDLEHRVHQHKTGQIAGFTKKYNVNKLIYYEEFQFINDAIAREKQIKGWSRKKKLALFEESNPQWEDLAEAWFDVPS